MTNGKIMTLLEKIELNQEKERQKQALLQQKKRQRERIFRRRRRVAGLVITFFLVFFIYATNLLLNDKSESHAIEAPTEEKASQKEKTIQVSTTNAPTVVETTKTKQSIYNENIPMPKEHQEYLYELCEQRGLDYHKTLAVVKHESNFNQNALNETNDYGYFQVNLVNHEDLSEKLHTDNSAFNPYINMNWGTYMLADLYSYWGEKGFSGDTLDEVVWSSYNKGITGFKNKGHATQYVYKMKEAIETINESF